MTDAFGIPLGLAAAGANRHDSKLLEPTITATKQQVGTALPERPTCHPDSAYLGNAVAAVLPRVRDSCGAGTCHCVLRLPTVGAPDLSAATATRPFHR